MKECCSKKIEESIYIIYNILIEKQFDFLLHGSNPNILMSF